VEQGHKDISCPAEKGDGMPSFFNFQQGRDPHGATTDSSPLLGRFRAVPDTQRHGNRGRSNSLLPSFARGYGSLFRSARRDGDDSDGESSDEEDGVLKQWARTSRDLWLEPKQNAVGKVVDKWWSRWAVLIVLPALLVSFAT
jgi:hypothetical protein